MANDDDELAAHLRDDGLDAAELLAWWRGRMQEIDKRPSSSGHGDADGLLCDAVVALAALLGQEEAGKQFIEAYDAIEKWYA